MKSKFKPQSTFQKLGLAFLLVGVLPLIMVVILFMRRYETNAGIAMENTMAEANYYAQSKVAQLVMSIDRATEVLYDHTFDGYSALWEVLESQDLNQNEKQMYLGVMLDELLKADTSASAAHFVTPDGSTYSRFYSQQKSLRTTPTPHHRLPKIEQGELRKLFLLEAAEEREWCNGSTDTVLTLARNYMDTRSLGAVTTVSLGTLYEIGRAHV